MAVFKAILGHMLPTSQPQAGHPRYSAQHMEKLKHIMVMQWRELPRPNLAPRDTWQLPQDRLKPKVKVEKAM